MGLLLKKQGNLDLAEPFLRRALEGWERDLGRDHPQTLSAVNNVGRLLLEQRRFRLAEPFFRRAVEGRERTLGRDHPDTLQSVNSLSFLLNAMENER